MSYTSAARSSHDASPLFRWRRRTPAVVAVLLRWLAALERMHARWCQRQALRDLDDRLLCDIAVTRQQAEREARKSFWM